MPLIHKIHLPTDFSEGADRALDYAIELGRAMNASLLITHAYAPPVVVVPEGFVAPPVDDPAVRAELEAGLSRLGARARERGITKIEIALGNGPAWREILRLTKESGADLIVMGTHGRGGFAHLLLGSVAEKIVRKSDVPVLTVGPHAAQVTP